MVKKTGGESLLPVVPCATQRPRRRGKGSVSLTAGDTTRHDTTWGCVGPVRQRQYASGVPRPRCRCAGGARHRPFWPLPLHPCRLPRRRLSAGAALLVHAGRVYNLSLPDMWARSGAPHGRRQVPLCLAAREKLRPPWVWVRPRFGPAEALTHRPITFVLARHQSRD